MKDRQICLAQFKPVLNFFYQLELEFLIQVLIIADIDFPAGIVQFELAQLQHISLVVIQNGLNRTLIAFLRVQNGIHRDTAYHGAPTQLLNYKDTICRRMEVMSASRQQEAQKPAPAAPAKPGMPAPKPPKIMTVRRYDLCSVKRLQSKEDIDKYVEAIREKLMKTLESCDGVQIN